MATTQKSSPTSAGSAVSSSRPRKPAAVVIPMPGAAPEPVAQMPRRGRFPQVVTAMWAAQHAHACARRRQADRLRAQLELLGQMAGGHMERVLAAQQHTAACREALKDAEAAERAAINEFGAADTERKRITAELRELVGAAT